jgi:hypothetical protein
MLTLAQCAAATGFATNDFFLGVTPSCRHRSLLDGYLANMGRGPEAIRDMMIADLRRWTQLGANARAADLLVVLRQFLSEYPQAVPAQAGAGHSDARVALGSEAESRLFARTRHKPASRIIPLAAGRVRPASAGGPRQQPKSRVRG